MESKELYKKFCAQAYVPVFSQPWWLDAAVGSENWDVYVVENNGTLCAAMPYYHTVKNGFTMITKAPNTQNNGIIFSYPAGQKIEARLSFQKKCIDEICDYIESLGLAKYEQQFHYSFDNWLPFFWRYYSQIVRYTYVIDTCRSIEDIVSGYASKLRNEIRKAQKTLSVKEDTLTADEFYNINRMSFMRQGIDAPYSLEYVRSIFSAGYKNNACKVMAAYDVNNNVYSVAFLVWDDCSVYYLLNGTNPEYKDSQANDLLIHEGIKFAKSKNLLFDFEGSVIPQINRAFRQFGGEAKPYFRIYKTFDPKLLEREQQEQMARCISER